MTVQPLPLSAARDRFLHTYDTEDRRRTMETYQKILSIFIAASGLTDMTPTQDLTVDRVISFLDSTDLLMPDTRQLYAACLVSFYSYLEAEGWLLVSISALRNRIRRSIGTRQTQEIIFPENAVEKVIDYAANLHALPVEDDAERLRNLRDRALVLLLGDSGFRIREACSLKRGDVDYDANRISVVGKGNRRALVRTTVRTTRAIKDYLSARSSLDGATGKPLQSLPLFARHDLGAGKHIKPIGTYTGRNIVARLVKVVLGDELTGKITPHTMRHRFVTEVLRATGNLKTAQKLARHKSITSTQRYAHLAEEDIDQAYYETFEQEIGDQ